MKKWETPEIFNLSIQYTFGSENHHYCHVQKGDCSDFNGGVHNNTHTIPEWSNCDGYTTDYGVPGHTCCCKDLIAPES